MPPPPPPPPAAYSKRSGRRRAKYWPPRGGDPTTKIPLRKKKPFAAFPHSNLERGDGEKQKASFFPALGRHVWVGKGKGRCVCENSASKKEGGGGGGGGRLTGGEKVGEGWTPPPVKKKLDK